MIRTRVLQARLPPAIETSAVFRHNMPTRPNEQRHPVIELSNVAYSYGGAELFGELNLSLSPGSFQFLTGPSGAGKTTLLKLCYGDLTATAGEVRIFGTETRRMTRDDVAMARRRIGVVHQDCQFLDHLPLRDNVLLPMTVSDRQAEGEAHVDDLLAWVGLKAQSDQFPPQLSGGERQRAALARAVITAPDVIIADEPTGNIDWDMSQRLLTLLVELNRMGKAVLIATHDLNLIRAAKPQVSARSLRLRNRRLQAAGADL
jgi:cell division transport system ATP-binding protein